MSLDPAMLALLKGAKNKYSRSNAKTVKLKEGKTRIRILQTEPKFWRDLAIHWIKAERNGKPVAVVGCHDHTYDKPCPICTAIDKATKAAFDDDMLALIREWKAKKSVLVNALVRTGPDASPDPQILELTPTTFGHIITIMEEYSADLGNVLDPETGLDFIIERRGKGLDTEYSVMPAPKSESVPKDALKRVHDLDAFIEREFFRGEETKALNMIGEITGVTVRLVSPATTGLLTSASTSAKKPSDEDDIAAIVEEIETKPRSAARKKYDDPITDPDLDDVLADLDKLTA